MDVCGLSFLAECCQVDYALWAHTGLPSACPYFPDLITIRWPWYIVLINKDLLLKKLQTRGRCPTSGERIVRGFFIGFEASINRIPVRKMIGCERERRIASAPGSEPSSHAKHNDAKLTHEAQSSNAFPCIDQISTSNLSAPRHREPATGRESTVDSLRRRS